MLYRKHKAYIVAIHGCPYWPTTGLNLGKETSYVGNHFSDFVDDGGTALDCLVSSPTFTQVLDATGGFARLSDTSFEIVDTHDNHFAKFFAASKITNTFTNLTSTLGWTATSMFVSSSDSMTVGDDWMMQQETVRVTGIVDTDQVTVTRGMYSAFVEGRWNSHAQTSPQLGVGHDLVKNGHWNHSGRWICVYEAETDYNKTFGELKRIYAGVIDNVSVDGRKISIATKSLTTLLSTPLMLNSEYKISSNVMNVLTERLYITNNNQGDMSVLDPAIITVPFLTINDIVENDLNYRALNVYSSGLLYDAKSGLLTVKYNGTALTNGLAPSKKFTHPAFSEFYNLTDSVYIDSTTTWMTSSAWPNDDAPLYDAILLPGWKFKFSEENSVKPSLRNQFFLFDDKLIAPCIYDAATDTWTVDDNPVSPWFTPDGLFVGVQDDLGYPARWLCLHRSRCKVKAVLCPGTAITMDLLPLIYQLLTSTGGSVNPYETGNFDWYQSMRFPYYLVDYASFANIYYPVRPMVSAKSSVMELFEQPVKIAGWRIVWSWSTGKLTAKQMESPSQNNSAVQYELVTQDVSKPQTQIGYQAPLSGCSIKFNRIFVDGVRTPTTYTFTMDSSVNQSNTGQTIELVDEWSTEQYALFSSVAHGYLYWLSTTVPGSVIKVTETSGNVGDVVIVTNKYIVGGDGYGVNSRAGLQTEMSYGKNNSIRCLFAGNTLTDAYCLLAPSAEVDLSVGTWGLLDGQLYLVPGVYENGKTFCQFVYDKYKTSKVGVCLTSMSAFSTVKSATLDVENNRINMPDGYSVSGAFFYSYQSSMLWVTVPNYWQWELL